MTLTAALLDATRPTPLITFYDDATGERVELSGVTTANWAAKTANLLRDECDVEPGSAVSALLPAHWQTAAVLLGAWWCGAVVVSDPGTADWVFCDRDRLERALHAGPAMGVIALSLDAFGRGLDDLPSGVIDYATEVRTLGDDFLEEPVPDDAAALDSSTVHEVVAEARDRAAALGIGPGDRVLSTLDWDTRGGLVDGLLAVLVAGASLVQVRHADPAALDRHAAAERVTVRLTG